MGRFQEFSDLTGRQALITGASGGLGKVFADTLAELGANLILTDRSPSGLQALSHDLHSNWGVRVDYFPCDLEIPQERTDFITTIRKSTQSLNVLVNTAALVGDSNIEGWTEIFEMQSIHTWRRALEVNLISIFDLCQGLLPLLKYSKGSSIVNIGSIYATYAPDWKLYANTHLGNPAAYGASKAGLVYLTKWLATTLAPDIRVNSISPGGIFRDQPQEFVDKYKSKTPLGRMATEDDLRGALAYLATDLSKFVTGQNLCVDGGWGIS